MLLPVYNLLADSGLDVLVHAGIREANQQPVGPRLADKPYFADNRLVMIRVVEAPDMLQPSAVDCSGREILDRRPDSVIVVGIVLKSVYLVF